MRTIRKVCALNDMMNSLQRELGRSQVDTAQRIAAEIADQLEAWQLDLMHIPPEERARYQTPNPYLFRVSGKHGGCAPCDRPQSSVSATDNMVDGVA